MVVFDGALQVVTKRSNSNYVVMRRDKPCIFVVKHVDVPTQVEHSAKLLCQFGS